MCPSHVTMYPTYGACCHISLPLFWGKSRKKVYTVLIKQNHIIVQDMWEINVGKNKYSKL